MLLHLCPKFYVSAAGVSAAAVARARALTPTGGFPKGTDAAVRSHISLVDVVSEDLGIDLRHGRDLALRTPYPNKRVLVACRNIGKRAQSGILIEVPEPPERFSITSRWAVCGEYIATHRVHYHLLDREYGAASDSPLLWSKDYKPVTAEQQLDRWPADYPNGTPMSLKPTMEVAPSCDRAVLPIDVLDSDGRIRERTEHFSMPSIPRGRVLPGGHSAGINMPDERAIFGGAKLKVAV